MVMYKIYKVRFQCESDENYPKDALHLYAEEKPAMKRNEVKQSNSKSPQALIQDAQNQKKTNTGGLAKLMKLKIGAKVII